MNIIHKYSLTPLLGMPNSTAFALISVGAKFIHFDMQNGTPTLWAEIDSLVEVEEWRFRIHGTGHQIPSGSTHVGTYLDGQFVWHVYGRKS